MADEQFVSNDATKKLLGYTYQELMAIETIFNAKVNDTIWLECKGDVADSMTVTEYKHHFGDDTLPNSSKDFWNTLKNMVEEKNLIAQFKHCVFSTTVRVSDKSIFFEWNKLTEDDKYEKLKSVSPTMTMCLVMITFKKKNFLKF